MKKLYKVQILNSKRKEKKEHVFYKSSTCFHEKIDENKMVIPLIVQN